MGQIYQAYINQPFTIECSAFDPDSYPGTGLTYAWIQVSGPAPASFSATSVLSPTITAPAIGQYVFQLTVSDSVTPTSQLFTVNILPLFTATTTYTAYCATGKIGTPVPFTALASSDTSQADALAKATRAASIAANAALVCAPYSPLPQLQINLYGSGQLDPSITQVQLSYLAAGTPSAPITETPLGTSALSPVPHPLAYVNTTIAEPKNLLWPYSTSVQLNIDDALVTAVPNVAPLYLILRAGPGAGSFPFPLALNLDSGPAGVSVTSVVAAGSVAAAPDACLVLPSATPGLTRVSLQRGTFIGFDTARWKPDASPATALLAYFPEGPLAVPTGLAPVGAWTMERASVPPLAKVIHIDTLLTPTQLSNPLFLAFYGATYDAGTGVHTPIANSIQFIAASVFSASSSAPPETANPYSILSLSGNPSLNIPAAANGVIYFPNPKYARVVVGMSTIP